MAELHTVPISEVAVGPRYRKELGAIDELAASMAALGQLQPIGVRRDRSLVFGGRRLAAARALGWPTIAALVFDSLDDAAKALKAERDENRCREEMKPSEYVALGRALEEVEREAARERQHELGRTHGTPSGKLPEGGCGDTRDRVADAIGVSGRTYEKAKQVVEAAETNPEAFGDLPARMDSTSVDGAHREMRARAEPALFAAPESVSLPAAGGNPRTGATQMAAWTPSERDRQKRVQAGETVLANQKADKALVEWAQQKGLYVYIGRPGEWRNPYVEGVDGDRETVIESFRLYFGRKYGLHPRCVELKGKVLGCWCYPLDCHGRIIIEHLQELDT